MFGWFWFILFVLVTLALQQVRTRSVGGVQPVVICVTLLFWRPALATGWNSVTRTESPAPVHGRHLLPAGAQGYEGI